MSTTEVSAPPSASSAEYVVGEIKRHKKCDAAGRRGKSSEMAAIGFGFTSSLLKTRTTITKPEAGLANMKISRLTANGKTTERGHFTRWQVISSMGSRTAARRACG